MRRLGKWRALLLLFLAMLLSAPGIAQLDKKQEKINAQHVDAVAAARSGAEAWLKIQDAGTYDKSWDAASDYFRSHVPKLGWERRMVMVRKPIDPMLTRDLSATEWKSEVPNLPKGEYVAFAYETVFASGHPQLETVVMVHESSAWKMVGYAVQ